MPENSNTQSLAKAQVFFKRAEKITETKNFDYAIDMYLQGLGIAPDALYEGHLKLYALALLRHDQGGKKPTMVERVKRLTGKTALEKMLNAEYLLAKDPKHLPYAQAMLKAAIEGDYKQTAKWLADFIFKANNEAAKPSLNTYLLLKNSYATLGLYDRALMACQYAVKLKPEDGSLADELQRLSAELTVSRGKYDKEGDFRKSIKDREAQDKLHSQEGVVKTEDYRITAVKDARKALAADPELPKNIFHLATVLAELQNDKADNEAIVLLENAYRTKNDFSYKQQAGLIKIKNLKRNLRKAKGVLESNPADEKAKALVAELTEKVRSTELEHYRLCVENYPTDLKVKYEYGVRLIQNKQYDDAIPLLQESQRDPRHRISSMGKIGLCFFNKGWYADAIDVFSQAIDVHESKDDSIAKDLRYNLARSYEKQGDIEKAFDIFRKIAQLDFGYRDVRKRVDELRKKLG